MVRRWVAIGVVLVTVNAVVARIVSADMGARMDATGAPTQAEGRMRAVALGGAHSCALLALGAVRCFGNSSYGQLGLGTILEVGASSATSGASLGVASAPAVPLSGGTVRMVAAGTDHTCALDAVGAVRCWGAGERGRLGYGDTLNRGDEDGEVAALDAVALGTGRRASAIAAGKAHTCALLDNAAVTCWGSNLRGQLGLGDTANRGDGPGEMGDALVAVAFAGGRAARAIAAGGDHTCAILDDDSLVCWGANESGQLGQGSTAHLGDNEPVSGIAAVPIGGVLAVALGDAHTCAVTTAAQLVCFGNGGNGRLGTNATDNRGDAAGEVALLPTIDFGASRSVRAVAAGGSHTCALLDDATVRCFGNGGNGRLGTDDSNDRGDSAGEMAALTAVPLAGDALGVFAGASHTCALLDDATLRCFGNATEGQIGSDNTASLGDEAGEMSALGAVALGGPVATVTEPSLPQSVTVVADETSATLTWLAPSSDGGSAITDYVVEYREASTTLWTRVIDGTSATTSATVMGLTTDVTYAFRVAAVNVVNTGVFTTASITATPTTTTTTSTTTTTTTTSTTTTTPASTTTTLAPPAATPSSGAAPPAATTTTTTTTSPTKAAPTTTDGVTATRTPLPVLTGAFESYTSVLTAAQRRQLARLARSLQRGDTVTCSTISASPDVVSSAGLRRATVVCRHLRELVPGLRATVSVRPPLTPVEERRMGVRGSAAARRVVVEVSAGD